MAPTGASGFLSDFAPTFGGQPLRSGFPALRATELPERYSGGIPVVRLAVVGLAGRDIANQLGEGDRIARALEPFCGHAVIIAQPGFGRTALGIST
jgi:hypothetical protein